MESESHEGIEILLVDDSESDRELFRLALEGIDRSTRLTTIGDGQEAFRLLAVKAESGGMPPPHVIVLDMRLPGMDGSDLLQFIKTHRFVCQTPVVMLSDMPEGMMQKQLPQADLISQKPARWAEFLDLIKAIMALAKV
jgi:CheY-like chemotaxis protein